VRRKVTANKKISFSTIMKEAEMTIQKRVAFIGAGSMAEAMISGMVKSGLISPENIIVTNRKNKMRLHELEVKYGIKGITCDEFDIKSVDVLFLAMKPKDAETALRSIENNLSNQLVLSVLAGITTSFIEERLPAYQSVIRVMPNTSSMIGESATAISPGENVSENQQELAVNLLKCIGEVSVIDEEQMDIFTGIAGSGPAYIYYLVEHIEQAGVKEGLDAKTAREIAVQTILGASKMMMETQESPETLRKNVTSPNGTTAAGLEALEKNGGGNAISKAVEDAAKRSREISNQLQEKSSVAS
jgi:pyrroline-5-carboxylate reductase